MEGSDVYRVRVCAAILKAGDQLLVARESRRARQCLNLPGGGPEPGETLEQAMIREIREETGFDVVPTEIAYVCERHAPLAEAELEVCFYAEIVSPMTREEHPGKNIVGLEWLDLDNEELLQAMPHVANFAARRRGRYIDQSRVHREHRPH